jgi:hypothetical protein
MDCPEDLLRLGTTARAFLEGAPRSDYTIRVCALSWLICRGLRATACLGAYDAAGLAGAAEVFGPRVVFEERTAGEPLYCLSDRLVIYRAGLEGQLSAVWNAHRATLTRGVELGTALGYFDPRPARASHGAVFVWHAVRAGEREILLWSEYVTEACSQGGPLRDHNATVGRALAEIGLAHAARLEAHGPFF